jgi:hypothetical protein
LTKVPTIHARLLATFGVAIALLLAGCGADEEEPATTAATDTGTVAPTVAAPPPVPTAQAPTKPAKPKKAAKPAAPQGTAACSVPDTVTKFTPQGVGCPPADAVATEWATRRINECSTIDDPSSPEGFKRTCEVQGYTCTAKRDVKSDARFVTCTGAGTIRFTWLPG